MKCDVHGCKFVGLHVHTPHFGSWPVVESPAAEKLTIGDYTRPLTVPPLPFPARAEVEAMRTLLAYFDRIREWL